MKGPEVSQTSFTNDRQPTSWRESDVMVLGGGSRRRVFPWTALLFCLLAGLWPVLPASAGVCGQPEAIVPTNSLPPAAGTYVLWPPDSAVVFDGTLRYLGTNYPVVFNLQEIEVGPFTNIQRSVSGKDLLLQFDATMATRVPYANMAGQVLTKVAIDGQTGHFRIRVIDAATPSTNHLSLILEMFSWTMKAKNSQGEYFDFIHVQNATNQVSRGWIETTPLQDGGYVMRSELQVFAEGRLLSPFDMDYTPSKPTIGLKLKGIARALQVLSFGCTEEGSFRVHSSSLGSRYLYGLDYSTNGTDWVEFSVPTVYGDTVSWFDDLQEWSDKLTNAPMKIIRLKARRLP